MRATIIAVRFVGVISCMALLVALGGLLTMLLIPAIKDKDLMTSFVQIALLASPGMTGLIAFAQHTPTDTIKQATLNTDNGNPQVGGH